LPVVLFLLVALLSLSAVADTCHAPHQYVSADAATRFRTHILPGIVQRCRITGTLPPSVWGWYNGSEEQLYAGDDGWTAVRGTKGVTAALPFYFRDTDGNGHWTPDSRSEYVWRETTDGERLYTHDVDIIVRGSPTGDNTGQWGKQTALFYADSNNNNVWDTNEDVWAAGAESIRADIRVAHDAVTGLIAKFVDHTDNTGDWTDQNECAPLWTEPGLLAAIGTRTDARTASLPVTAAWFRQQENILNLLQCIKQRPYSPRTVVKVKNMSPIREEFGDYDHCLYTGPGDQHWECLNAGPVDMLQEFFSDPPWPFDNLDPNDIDYYGIAQNCWDTQAAELFSDGDLEPNECGPDWNGFGLIALDRTWHSNDKYKTFERARFSLCVDIPDPDPALDRSRPRDQTPVADCDWYLKLPGGFSFRQYNWETDSPLSTTPEKNFFTRMSSTTDVSGRFYLLDAYSFVAPRQVEFEHNYVDQVGWYVRLPVSKPGDPVDYNIAVIRYDRHLPRLPATDLDTFPVTTADAHLNTAADTDRDDLVDVGTDLTAFGPDTGTIVLEPERAEPQVFIPLAVAQWNALPVHAYIAQGAFAGMRNGHWTHPDATEPGLWQACSLHTRVRINYVDAQGARGTRVKRVDVIRPRGNCVTFEFPWQTAQDAFSAFGYPLAPNASRSYVLHDTTGGDHTDLAYELHFDSGIIHRFNGTDGTLRAVAHSDGRSTDIDALDGVWVDLTGNCVTSPRYNVQLTWVNGLIQSMRPACSAQNPSLSSIERRYISS